MKPALAAGLAAVLFGALVLIVQPFSTSPPGSSASRTVYSFAYALEHHNYGRACSYLNDAMRGRGASCRLGLESNAAMGMMFGADLWDHMHVVAGSRRDLADGSVTYKVASSQIQPTRVTVAKQKASGKWRVVKIG